MKMLVTARMIYYSAKGRKSTALVEMGIVPAILPSKGIGLPAMQKVDCLWSGNFMFIEIN
jgi:hypothetical protein